MLDIYRTEHGEMVLGKSFPLFVMEGKKKYILARIDVYGDGKILCSDPGDDLFWERGSFLPSEMSLDEFVQAVEQGKLVTILPENVSLCIRALGTFTVTKIATVLERRDVILMVQDILRELRGEPNALQMCRTSFFSFLDDLSPQRQAQLRHLYDAVPSPQRISILDDIENGDTSITAILAREDQDIDRGWLEDQKREYAFLRQKDFYAEKKDM